MNTQLQTEKIRATNDKLDILRNVTAALLDEVKSLSTLKMIEQAEKLDFDNEVKRFEIYLIERALRQAGGCQRIAASILQMKTTTLNAKIKRYRITVSKPVNRAEDSLNGWT
jgi:transcriptional regulator with GAF, ATPase, and Fis domain